MDPYLIVILVVLVAVLLVAIFMAMECLDGALQKDRRSYSSDSSAFIVTERVHDYAGKDDIEANLTEKSTKPNPIEGFLSQIHRGSLSLHAQGLCNHGGGAWGTVTSVSGRASTTNIWSPVSGGIYDSCQCEDNGGFH